MSLTAISAFPSIARTHKTVSWAGKTAEATPTHFSGELSLDTPVDTVVRTDSLSPEMSRLLATIADITDRQTATVDEKNRVLAADQSWWGRTKALLAYIFPPPNPALVPLTSLDPAYSYNDRETPLLKMLSDMDAAGVIQVHLEVHPEQMMGQPYWVSFAVSLTDAGKACLAGTLQNDSQPERSPA